MHVDCLLFIMRRRWQRCQRPGASHDGKHRRIGAIFGLFGILLVLLLLNDARFIQVRSGILVNAGIFVGLNLLIGAGTPGIDNAAHVGGLAVGAALGMGLFLVQRFRSPVRKPV